MTITPGIVNDVLDSLDAAIQALRNQDNEKAQHHADGVRLRGQLLAVHPEFARQAESRCPRFAPADLIEGAAQLLGCIAAAATDGQKTAPSLVPPLLHNGHSNPA